MPKKSANLFFHILIPLKYFSKLLAYRQVITYFFVYTLIMKFTERFNELVALSEKSQVQIDNEINVSKQCISDYKSGKSFPSLQTLFLICRCLETSADYLLGLTDEY